MKKELAYLSGLDSVKVQNLADFVQKVKRLREHFMSRFPQETEIEQEFNSLAKKIENLKKDE